MSMTGNATSNFQKFSDDTLTVILIGAGVVYIMIGLFVHNTWIKAAAAAYAALP